MVSLGEIKTTHDRKPLSISANIETSPIFAENLRFYRDSRVMTPLVMFLLDQLLEREMIVDELAEHYEECVDMVVQELLKG